jgi:ABC-type enterochelin transport system substrate-binding protein
MHYDERVKPAVEAEIGDRKVTRTERFAITNKLLADIYDKEPESLKEEIRQVIEKARQEKEAEKALSMSVLTADETMGPKEYLK